MSMELGDFLAAAMGFNPNEEPTPKDMRDDMFIKGYPRKSFDADGLTPFRVELPPIANTMAPKTAFWPKDLATIRRVIPVHSVQMDSFRRIATAHVATPYVTSEGESECRTLLTTVLVAVVLRHEDVRSAFAYLSSELKDKKNKYVGRVVMPQSRIYGSKYEVPHRVICVEADDEAYFVGCPPNVHMARAAKLFSDVGVNAATYENYLSQLRSDVDPTASVTLEKLDVSESLKPLIVGKQASNKLRIQAGSGVVVWSPPQALFIFGGEEEREYAKLLIRALVHCYDRDGATPKCTDMFDRAARTSVVPFPLMSMGYIIGSNRNVLGSLEQLHGTMVVEGDRMNRTVDQKTLTGHDAATAIVVGSMLGRWSVGLSIVRSLSNHVGHSHYAPYIEKFAMSVPDETEAPQSVGAECISNENLLPLHFASGYHRQRFAAAANVAAEFLTRDRGIIIGQKQYRSLFRWLVMQRTTMPSYRSIILTTVVRPNVITHDFVTTVSCATIPGGTMPMNIELYGKEDSPLFKEIDKVQTETSTCFVLVGDSTDGPFLGFGVVGVSPYAREHAAARITDILSKPHRISSPDPIRLDSQHRKDGAHHSHRHKQHDRRRDDSSSRSRSRRSRSRHRRDRSRKRDRSDEHEHRRKYR
eukprot:PhM_4_TR15699/c0_g1_i3/m.54568